MSNRIKQSVGCIVYALCLSVLFVGTASPSDGHLQIKNLCRLKGQETNTLYGLGLVVGLNGTGDEKISQTTRTLAAMMQNLGGNIAVDQIGFPNLDEFKDTGNVALVNVTVTVPATGIIQGELLDCSISAIHAKSLKGGVLFNAILLGPRSDVSTIYGLASGRISLPDPTVPTSGVVLNGCKMEATVKNTFVESDSITLVIDPNVASFAAAVDITYAINSHSGINLSSTSTNDASVATAIDQMHIVVKIPPKYRQDGKTVEFVSLILEIPLTQLKSQDRVVINEREGIVIIGENVRISPVAINHKNLAIEARNGPGKFVGVDIDSPQEVGPRLKNLVEALNALNVPTSDVIAIIRTLKRNGALYGELVIQ